MRVLMLTRFPNRAAGHFRFFQYLPVLEKSGITVEPAPMFGDHYLHALLDGGSKSVRRILADYGRRVMRMLTASGFDLLWVHLEALPWMPAIAESLLTMHGIPYVVDYDDAWFHRYGLHRNPLVRRLLGKKIDWVMRHARLVLVGNAYIADYARRAGARWIERVPTVVNLDDYSALKPPRNQVYTIGWLGSQSVSVCLAESRFSAALAEVCRLGKARLVVVGANPPKLPGVPVETHRWSRETEASEIAGFDVGVSPLFDSPFERGKCGFKTVQYMAAARPVVISPVGMHKELVSNGVTGFLATSTEEWVSALEALRDAGLSAKMGSAGRKLVEEKYCIQTTGPHLADLLKKAALTPARDG